MTAALRSRRRSRSPHAWPLQPLLDCLALLLWGLMLTRLAVTGKLFLLLHPDYMWLSNLAAATLLGLGLWRSYQVSQLWSQVRQGQVVNLPPEHLALLPRRLSSLMLILVALVGLFYNPRPFTSETAFQRGITDVLSQTRSSPQRFVVSTTPADRTIVDWVRTLNVYPEPDAYADQPVNVSGFVVQQPDWPLNYFMISRFVLTCCAADAYPVGLPVQLPEGQPRPTPDTWLQISGVTATATLANQRQLVITRPKLTKIPEPKNPYEY